ncbi:hypothetical protein [Streptomyces sp. NPDC055036]
MDMAQETPIYAQLVGERGDVPAQVSNAAKRIHKDLARIIGTSTAPPPGRATQHRPGTE